MKLAPFEKLYLFTDSTSSSDERAMGVSCSNVGGKKFEEEGGKRDVFPLEIVVYDE